MTNRAVVGLIYLAVAVLAAVAGAARAATGDVAYVDCLSGELNLAACTPVSGATADGVASGLGRVGFIGIGVNGTWLYATARGDDAVAWFQRTPAGVLTYAGCIGSDSDTSCTLIPGAVSTGVGTVLHNPEDVLAGPDGANLYVLGSVADAVVRFSIDAAGTLSFVDCIGGNTDIVGCTYVPAAAPSGIGSDWTVPRGS